MSLKGTCIKALAPALFLMVVSCSAVAQEARIMQPLPPDRCAVERLSRPYLEKMCAYDDISALATIAFADELQFSLIWQQADEIMRAARHLDKEVSLASLTKRHLKKPVQGGQDDQVSGSQNPVHPFFGEADGESETSPLIGGCVLKMKVLDEKWIEIVRATCAEDVSEALKIKLAHLYVPGPMNGVQGAKIRRRQVPSEGMPPPMRRMGGLSYANEEALLKERLCLPYVAARYKDVCKKPLPDGYARLCKGTKADEDAVLDFWAQRQELMIQNIVQKARKLAAQKEDEHVRRSRIYRLDIEGIEASQNGLVDIEVCPQKPELIDMIAAALKEGLVRKTQSGVIWEAGPFKDITETAK